MISILLPVYNIDVCGLTSNLSDQVLNSRLNAEIIVMDDGSDEKYSMLNSIVSIMPFVKYIKLEKNIGRINIRKKLAATANYDWLLFIDGDSKILSEEFLISYYKSIASGKDVIAGGRVYDPEAPVDHQYSLHWKYGREREKNKTTNSNSFYGFMSNNFMIKKNVFTQITFNDALSGYGHEDTLMGIELENMNCTIRYINNPVLHLVLDANEAFINKAKNALINLKNISYEVPRKILIRHVKLFRYYALLQSWHIVNVFKAVVIPFKNYIEKNIQSNNPSLFLFDVYRLFYFSNIPAAINRVY